MSPSKRHNTKTTIPSLGEVELKYLSYGDTLEIFKILEEKNSDRNFVAKVLMRQLIKPKGTNLATIKGLADEELMKLAKAFVKTEGYTFKHFKQTGSYYKDFRQALRVDYKKQAEEFRKTYEPAIQSARKELLAFSNRYAPILRQALNRTSYIQKSLEDATSMARHFQNAQLRLEAARPRIDQLQEVVKTINQSLRPQIEYWQRWVEQNRKSFESFANFWTEFQQKYNIAQKEAARILKKYKWFITPSMPLPLVFKIVKVGKKPGRQDKAMNKLFIEYFKSNNWQNLETMVHSWKNNPLLKKRYKILADCVQALKSASNSKGSANITNAVLPTVITQIDGALMDYIDRKGIPWQGYATRNTQVRASKAKALPDELDEQATDIFLNILFQRSQPGIPLQTPFNFNRHKILHGENVHYGRQDYLIRSFMVLDLLAHF